MRLTLAQAVTRAKLNEKAYGGSWEVRVVGKSLIIQMVEAGGMLGAGKVHYRTTVAH